MPLSFLILCVCGVQHCPVFCGWLLSFPALLLWVLHAAICISNYIDAPVFWLFWVTSICKSFTKLSFLKLCMIKVTNICILIQYMPEMLWLQPIPCYSQSIPTFCTLYRAAIDWLSESSRIVECSHTMYALFCLVFIQNENTCPFKSEFSWLYLQQLKQTSCSSMNRQNMV